jgi:hypothetical protein
MKTRSDARLYVIVSDVHVPYHDKDAADALCELIRDLKPYGFVINGDFLDLLELSRHSSSSVKKLEGKRVKETFCSANKLLDQYEKALGATCKDRRFLDGNHEDRMRRWFETADNAVWAGDESASISARLHFRDRGYVYYEGYPEARTRLGHLLITHGEWAGNYAAATHVNHYRESVLVGHVHTPGAFYARGLDRKQAGFVQGHMADIDSEAMDYKPAANAWRTGFSLVYLEPDGNFHVQLINFVDGKFFYANKGYGKKCR